MNGKDISNDFEAQVRFIFAKLDKTLKQAGGSLRDMVEMTVYITDVANGASFAGIRKELFPSGNYPASSLVTISHLAFPGMVVEISGTAVIAMTAPPPRPARNNARASGVFTCFWCPKICNTASRMMSVVGP
ncbi:MAG: RidA family protein [Xanthobacteraceae bacterium]